MSKKELYKLAVKLAQVTLRDYFQSPTSFTDNYFMKQKKCAAAIKQIFDELAPMLLKKDE